MAIDQNGPDAAYPGPGEEASDIDKGQGSGLEHAESEPKQGVGQAWSDKRPEDWNPPPDNDAAGDEDDKAGEAQVPLSPNDEAPIEEEMKDVDANNSVSSEHPQSR